MQTRIKWPLILTNLQVGGSPSDFFVLNWKQEQRDDTTSLTPEICTCVNVYKKLFRLIPAMNVLTCTLVQKFSVEFPFFYIVHAFLMKRFRQGKEIFNLCYKYIIGIAILNY